MCLDSNWVGRNDDWLLDDDLGGGGERNHWISPSSAGVLLCSLSYKTFCLSVSGNEWTHCPGQLVVFPSPQIEIQLFGFCNMTSSLLLWPWSESVVNGMPVCWRARVLQMLELTSTKMAVWLDFRFLLWEEIDGYKCQKPPFQRVVVTFLQKCTHVTVISRLLSRSFHLIAITLF